MLQIIYVSTANRTLGPVDLDPILEVARASNVRDGITGMLYADGARFLHVLEGPASQTAASMARIRRDVRHKAIVQLVRRPITAREFGDAPMASISPGDAADRLIEQVGAIVANGSLGVRATLEGFIRERTQTRHVTKIVL
ncbi:BLUF domain-containing protein [Sphingomonas sp. CJ20]